MNKLLEAIIGVTISGIVVAGVCTAGGSLIDKAKGYAENPASAFDAVVEYADIDTEAVQELRDIIFGD